MCAFARCRVRPVKTIKFINGQFDFFFRYALGSNILTLSYETSPACNVLVSENPEIAAAKSTVQGTNKSTSNRAKTSTPSTSTLSSSASSASASSSSASSSAASSTSLSTNNNQSSGSSSAATSPGGNKNNLNKRNRRSVNDAAKLIAVATIVEQDPCTKNGNSNCENSKNFDASSTMRSISDVVVVHKQSYSVKPSTEAILIDANRLVDRNDDSHSSNARELNEFIENDDFQFDEKPSAKSSNENLNVVTDMFDDGSGHHASTNHITSTSKTNNNNFDGKIIADKIPIEGNDAVLNDAPSIIFYDSPTGDATRNDDDDHPNDKFSDSFSDASAAIPNIVELAIEKANVITDKSVRDKYKYNVVVSDTPNDIDGNEIPETPPNDDENERANDIFVETAPSNQPPDFRMLDDINRLTNDSSIENQTQRILVNISIATDSGAGSQNHGVYMLHVAVPVGPEFMSNIDFQNASHVHHPHTVNVTPSFHKNDDFGGADSSSSPCPCDCNAALRNQWNATERESMANESTAQNDRTSTAPPSSPPSPPPPPPSMEENRFCLNEQDIPPILILEGEPYR